MPIIEAIGWLALTFGSHSALPISPAIDKFNTEFARRVDAGKSCWDRVSGSEGHYGGPEEFSLDPLCNYRIESYETEDTVTRWRLIRDF